MQEAQIRFANLLDVELEDFIRFCQFADRGDYTPPHILDESTAMQGKGKDRVGTAFEVFMWGTDL
jgi:hypothetical protein